jgi:hypothetical protein
MYDIRGCKDALLTPEVNTPLLFLFFFGAEKRECGEILNTIKIKRMREAIVSVSILSVSQGAVSMNEKKLMAS